MNRRPWLGVVCAAGLVATVFAPGCSCSDAEETVPIGQLGAGGSGSSSSSTEVTVGSTGTGVVECDTPCTVDEVCSHGACVPLLACTSDDDCKNDTTCDPDVGCVPWEGQDPGFDEECVNAFASGILSPTVKCEFSVAPPGDPFELHVDVQGTPIVVNFNQPADAGPPSIAASFTATVVGGYTEDLGVVRVLRGDDCTLEANLAGTDVDGDGDIDWTRSSAALAAGDLDGDGVAEIVAYHADGSTLAFSKKDGAWGLHWKSDYVSPIGGGWAGVSIHDLDDDGIPEIIREGAVLGADGALVAPIPGEWVSYSAGLFPVLANLDGDPAVEMTNGQYIWQWVGGGWTLEPDFPGGNESSPGHAAIADFGAYGAGLPAETPEIAVVRDDLVMVYARTGEFAQAPIAVPGPGGGGPPTISDFDGDGLPELAVAGQAYYTIYDIDCGPTPRPGGVCESGPCDFAGAPCAPGGGIAWSRTTQDISSNITGSSVFDFEADDVSEVVYADECFVRVYNGQTGDVLFSQYRSSCTWYENPIIADVDGNFRADLVTPSNKACSPTGDGIACQMLDENGVDTQFPGLRCEDGGDCASGVCDAGLCRCASGAECCAGVDEAACLERGYKCAPPPDGTPGTGNTCRAAHPHGVSGIRVYSDANDKWVRSRTIWNQHAYAVTHVNEDGTIPSTSEWQNNWEQPELNNFRQNVPGDASGNSTGDLTAGANDQYACDPSSGVILSAPICNRGTAPIAPGLSVGFYVAGELVCASQTSEVLDPDECEVVSCTWADPPTSVNDAVDVSVVPNDQGQYAECKPGNNEGTVLGVYCEPAS